MKKTTGVAASTILIGAFGFAAMAAPAAVGTGATETRMVVAHADKPAGRGVVNTVDVAARKINMTHGPVAALKWPAMTMDFVVAPGLAIDGLKPGAKVGFTLVRQPDGMYAIDSIKPE